MQQAPQPNERFLFNEAIEIALINTSQSAAAILSYIQVPRGALLERLYGQFYNDFTELYILTRDLEHLEQNRHIIEQVKKWVEEQPPLTDPEVLQRCRSGIDLFGKYKQVLHGQGLVTLPKKR